MRLHAKHSISSAFSMYGSELFGGGGWCHPHCRFHHWTLDRALRWVRVLIVDREKIHSVISAHHLIGEYFLSSKCDKRMHLFTGLYSMFASTSQNTWLRNNCHFL